MERLKALAYQALTELESWHATDTHRPRLDALRAYLTALETGVVPEAATVPAGIVFVERTLDDSTFEQVRDEFQKSIAPDEPPPSEPEQPVEPPKRSKK